MSHEEDIRLAGIIIEANGGIEFIESIHKPHPNGPNKTHFRVTCCPVCLNPVLHGRLLKRLESNTWEIDSHVDNQPFETCHECSADISSASCYVLVRMAQSHARTLGRALLDARSASIFVVVLAALLSACAPSGDVPAPEGAQDLQDFAQAHSGRPRDHLSAHGPERRQPRSLEKKGCKLLAAIACPVGIECDHGYDVCPTCDPCDCGGIQPGQGD